MTVEDKHHLWRRTALSESEWNAKLVLDEVFQHGNYVVFLGFKLSIVIYEPPKGFSQQSPEWNYATRAHFDFVVCHAETHLPEFAIELDDPTHWTNPEAQRRDRMKNALCEAAGFEVLRIESSTLSVSPKTGNRRLIEYLIDAWEWGKAFTEGIISIIWGEKSDGQVGWRVVQGETSKRMRVFLQVESTSVCGQRNDMVRVLQPMKRPGKAWQLVLE